MRFAAENVLDALAPTNFPVLNPAALKATLDTGGQQPRPGHREPRARPLAPAAHPGDGRRVRLHRRRGPRADPRRRRAADRAVRAHPVRAEHPEGARDAAAARPADDQQVLHRRHRAGAQHARVLRRRRPAVLHDLLAQPGRAPRRVGARRLRVRRARVARRGRAITGSDALPRHGAVRRRHHRELRHRPPRRQGRPRPDRRPDARRLRARQRATPGPWARSSTARRRPPRSRSPSARATSTARALAGVFAWLRPNDLVWNYWVNNYLLGKDPPAFDVLYWNADSTNLPHGLHRDFMELSLANDLVRPGERVVLDTPIDLSKITVDSYQVAGIADHITPWQSNYRSTQLLGLRSALRALDQRAHRLARQPAGQREGQLPGQRLQPARGRGVAARGDHAQGHLVGRLRRLAGGALRRGEAGAASGSAARASSRSTRRRAATCWTDRGARRRPVLRAPRRGRPAAADHRLDDQLRGVRARARPLLASTSSASSTTTAARRARRARRR